MLDWTATREVRAMPKKRYTPEEIIQHLRTVELDTGKGLAVLDSCRKLGITEQDARSASQRGTVLHAGRSPDHHRTLEDSLQHGPSAQQSRGPATRSRNYPDCELRTNMVGGRKLQAGQGRTRLQGCARTCRGRESGGGLLSRRRGQRRRAWLTQNLTSILILQA